MRKILWMLQQIAFRINAVLGGKAKRSMKYTHTYIPVYFTLMPYKRPRINPISSDIRKVAAQFADTMQDYLSFGRYEHCCIFINHLVAETHSLVIILATNDVAYINEKMMQDIYAKASSAYVYANSLMEVVDPTLVDFDILRGMKRGLAELLNAIDEYDPSPDAAVKEVNRIINDF